MNILALDLGRYKTVFCEYDSENGEHDFGKIISILLSNSDEIAKIRERFQ